MNAPYDSRNISRAPGARQCGGALKFSGVSIDFYGMLGRGAHKISKGHFSLTQSSQHERGRLPGLIKPFVDQMRLGSVHVNASRKTFKNIYARFHTLHRMGAYQERAAFFSATLLVVTRHPGGPPGRPKIHPVLPRFALFFIMIR
jgi:hypothetical protein